MILTFTFFWLFYYISFDWFFFILIKNISVFQCAKITFKLEFWIDLFEFEFISSYVDSILSQHDVPYMMSPAKWRSDYELISYLMSASVTWFLTGESPEESLHRVMISGNPYVKSVERHTFFLKNIF